MNEEQILKDHRQCVSASNAYRLMTNLDKDELPKGARVYISAMIQFDDQEFKKHFSTPDTQWGIDHEVEAIQALGEFMEIEFQNIGEEQERMYGGKEWFGFLSALPDGIGMIDEVIATLEVKCLNSKNHQFAVDNIVDQDSLLEHDFEKYCQVQTQNACAEAYYGEAVQSILCYYDPRNEETPLHYIVVEADQEWRAKFKERLGLAKQLYDRIQAEDQGQSHIDEGPLLPMAVTEKNELSISKEKVDLLLDNPKKVLEMVYDHFGIRIQKGKFIGGIVNFDVTTNKGLEEARKFRRSVVKIRTGLVSTSKSLVDEYRAKVKQEQAFRRDIEEGMKEVEAYLCQQINNWEEEQAEKERIEVEKQREADETMRQREEQRVEIIQNKMRQFINTPSFINVGDLDDFVAKQKAIEIDELYQEFQAQAEELKAEQLRQLAEKREELVKRNDDIFKRRHDMMVSRYAGYESPDWTTTGLETKLAELKKYKPTIEEFGPYLGEVISATNLAIGKLANDLIPAAKKREKETKKEHPAVAFQDDEPPEVTLSDRVSMVSGGAVVPMDRYVPLQQTIPVYDGEKWEQHSLNVDQDTGEIFDTEEDAEKSGAFLESAPFELNEQTDKEIAVLESFEKELSSGDITPSEAIGKAFSFGFDVGSSNPRPFPTVKIECGLCMNGFYREKRKVDHCRSVAEISRLIGEWPKEYKTKDHELYEYIHKRQDEIKAGQVMPWDMSW